MSTLAIYLGQAKCTPQLRETVYASHPTIFSWHPSVWSTYVDTLRKMVSHPSQYLGNIRPTNNLLVLGLW